MQLFSRAYALSACVCAPALFMYCLQLRALCRLAIILFPVCYGIQILAMYGEVEVEG